MVIVMEDISFYDQDGNLIESGNVITDTLTCAESENFIMEAYSVWKNGTAYKVLNAFRTDDDKNITRRSSTFYF